MNLPEHIKNDQHMMRLIEATVAFKEEFVKTDKEGDLPPIVYMERGGKLELLAVAPIASRDYGIGALHIMGRSFLPDALTIATDTHAKMMSGDPDTIMKQLEEYEHGDLQKECEGGACATGEVAELIQMFRATRDGSTTTVNLFYHPTMRGEPVRWIERGEKPWMDKVNDGSMMFDGLIPEKLREALSYKTHEETFADMYDSRFENIPLKDKLYLIETIAKISFEKRGFTLYDFREEPAEL